MLDQNSQRLPASGNLIGSAPGGLGHCVVVRYRSFAKLSRISAVAKDVRCASLVNAGTDLNGSVATAKGHFHDPPLQRNLTTHSHFLLHR
jgi:hypothetical protein